MPALFNAKESAFLSYIKKVYHKAVCCREILWLKIGEAGFFYISKTSHFY